MLRELARGELPAVQEVHARLQRLYPDVDVAHMPSDLIQETPHQQPAGGVASEGEAAAADGNRPAGGDADCDHFVANAAVAGDTFAWHIDADPAGAYAQFVQATIMLLYLRSAETFCGMPASPGGLSIML